jgi:hypothetical protein
MSTDEPVGEVGPERTRADGGGVVRTGAGGTVTDDESVAGGPLRPLLRTAGWVLATFAVVGVGYGLAANFTIGFLIETFVDPGANPLDNTLVGIVLVLAVVNTMLLGPVLAAVAGLSVGRSYPDRGVLVAGLSGVSSTLGFYVLAALALFLTFGVLSQYAPAAASGAAAGSSSSSGPFTVADLRPTLVEVGIPTGLVGAVTGYVGSRLAE